MGIRLATKMDLDDILNIERLSFQNPWDYSYFNAALKNLLLVYEDTKTKKVVGYLVAVCKQKRAVILKLAVHPEHRGKGIATSLLKATLEILKDKKIDEVEIDVNMINRGAFELYEKVGFKITRTVPMNSEDESFYTMKLKLNSKIH